MFASYHVHRAHPSDRVQILQLQADSVLDGGHGVDDAGVIEALLDEPAPDLDGLIRAGRYFVAAAGGRIVAGAGWAPQESLGDVALMRGVCVHPDHRASGVGRRLVEIAEDAAVTAGHGVILAPVAATSAMLFESMGYLASGAVEVELSPGRRLQRRKMWKQAA
jgi:GNAT superfamily N-acetyltransferase